jgi:primosomal protein N' (replication factor Y)
MAAVDGAPEAVTALLQTAQLPGSADLLGPVDLPTGARRPPGTPAAGPVKRMLVRVPRSDGLELAAALRRATGVLSARHDQQPVRVQIDPLHIG